MEKWKWATLLVCLYGFFREVRPSESFLTQYLEGPWKNLTDTQVNNEVYPVWTYSYLALLLVTLLVTDFLRYKPVIVLEGLAYITTWLLLLWAPGVLGMQFMEFSFGIVSATEVAYYTYIYAKIDKIHYKRATSFVRAASLFGQFLSGGLAQILVSTDAMDYHELNYISLASVSVACLITFFLPPVAASIYFHRLKSNPEVKKEADATSLRSSESIEETAEYERVACGKAVWVVWRDFKVTYTNWFQIKWCLWWVLATCSFEQASNYIQPLWEEIYASEGQDNYQGAQDAINTLLGALGTVAIGFLHTNWDNWGELTLALVSFVQGAVLAVSSQTTNIWLAYTYYGIYTCCFHVLITIASFQVAKNLTDDSYGLIFGCNQFFALALQTILTVVLVDEHGFNAGPRLQFEVYGVFNGVIGLLFMLIAIHTYWSTRRRVSKETPGLEPFAQENPQDCLQGELEGVHGASLSESS